MNQFKWIFVSTACLLSISSVAVYSQNGSQQEDASNINLENIACRNLVKLGDTDQEATMAYVHGFLSGKNNELTVDVVKLGDVSEKAFDYCIDNPDDSLLSVFEQYRNN